jgi:hypothetical protein
MYSDNYKDCIFCFIIGLILGVIGCFAIISDEIDASQEKLCTNVYKDTLEYKKCIETPLIKVVENVRTDMR